MLPHDNVEHSKMALRDQGCSYLDLYPHLFCLSQSPDIAN